VAHHADYLKGRDDHTLCGVALSTPTALGPTDAAGAVCPDCEAQLVVYHLEWWREKALTATAELEELRAKHSEVPEPDATPELDDTRTEPVPTDATYLDRARREVVELCRQFEGAVPFFRLKNTMQDFSDRLDDPQRALLAQEVGADSSLLRWATTEVESLGLTVTNNRVQENSDMMWEEWLQESQQAAPKSKRRFGRSR
jgi:hypothetical protein